MPTVTSPMRSTRYSTDVRRIAFKGSSEPDGSERSTTARGFIDAIASKNIWLIADACYSGTVSSARSARETAVSAPSR